MEKFKQLGISECTLCAIQELGFEDPSEIQEKSIPLVLEGKDVIAGASTGSGKTLAFGAGVIHNARPDYGIQGLILTPTRELAEQITRELRKFTGKKKLNIISIYGGMPMGGQILGLETAEIVVGTPGRILDHLSRRTVNFQYIKTLVLDEADRMFDMGFKKDVEMIINKCPKKRQTLLYSATISQEIVMLAAKHMIDPIEVSAEVHVDPEKLKQIYYNIPDNLKYSLLKHLLEHEKSELVMVFCNTRRNVDFVVNNLKALGIDALPIHGGFTQDKRNKIMETFHSNKVNILVCTDVAARGLDIKNVTHIYNYDIPNEAKEYVHRIGRTARAGEEGRVINIITSRDYGNYSDILKHHPEFNIALEPTPYIKRAEIKWMAPSRSYGRGNGRRNYSRDGEGRSRRYGRNDKGPRDSRGNNQGGPSYGGRRDSRSSYSGRSYGGRGDSRPSGGRSYSRNDRSSDNNKNDSGPRRYSRNKRKSSSGRSYSGIDNRTSGGRRNSRR